MVDRSSGQFVRSSSLSPLDPLITSSPAGRHYLTTICTLSDTSAAALLRILTVRGPPPVGYALVDTHRSSNALGRMESRVSPYAQHDTLALAPLTDEPCANAPQEGVHLYHFAISLCSQKVRQGLDEKRVPYISHQILLPAHEQYDPEYVRINPRCVVPTLVVDGRVTTDSENILRYVNRTFDGPDLLPEGPEVDTFIKRADALFMEAITYGDVPGAKRPFFLRVATRGEHQKKAALLERLATAHPDLKSAYESKLAIVRAVGASIRAPDDMAEILASTERNLDAVEAQLESGPFRTNGWLCSPSFSLADLEWGIVLNRFRMVNLLPRFMSTRSHVARYAEKLFLRPAFQSAVVAWENPLTRIALPIVARTLSKPFKRRGRAIAAVPSP